MPRLLLTSSAAAIAALALTTAAAVAQIAVSAQDAKVRLVDGKVTTVKDGADNAVLIDLSSNPPKVIAELKLPASVVGPPSSVAVSPSEEIALITSAEKIDPADATKRVPNDQVTVIELNTKAPGVIAKVTARIKGATIEPPKPKVLSTLTAGKGAAGVSINRAGTLAIVANRGEGTLSVFSIKGKAVTALPDKVKIGDEKSGPSAIVFSADGKRALVTRDGDNRISMLDIDGTKVTVNPRVITAGLRPYGADISGKGDVAVVANIGTGSGDADTISLIDLVANPPRVVITVTAGPTPEGIKMSPDGQYVAVTVMNGTNKPATDPFFKEKGKLVVFRRAGLLLTDVGKWCQGIAWSKNGRTVVAQCMVEEMLFVFGFDGRQLRPMDPIRVKGGPAGIRTAEK
ncbi:MAG TPA: YncE family protein [Hyphomicrobiaceae bacterium]|nr:YncE family protein [Hyphomicrobiaceae bacterium]